MVKLVKKSDIPVLEKVLIIAIPSEKKMEQIREKTWKDEIDFDNYELALQDPKNQNFVAMFKERQPFTIVSGEVTVAGESFIADITITADHGKLRFAKVVKRYSTQPISKEDMIKFSKETEDFKSMFKSKWKDVTDYFSEWKPLSNAIFGVRETWNDCGAFQNFVFYKVENKVFAIRVALAEGKTKRIDDYNKKNVGEVLFTIKSEDVIEPSIHFGFVGNDVVKTTNLKMSYDERILSKEILYPEWSEEETCEGGQFYYFDSFGIWFEVPSLNLKVNTTFDCGITLIVERPKGFTNPQEMEIDKCPITCTVQYVKLDNRTTFVEKNYLFKVKILSYSEPTFRKRISGYSSYGDAENRRNGVDS